MKGIDWCLEKGKTEKRKHRGLRIVEPDVSESKRHLEKAEHNIAFMMEVKRLRKYNDWVFPAAFYSAYHACLAVLKNFGYDSRNQECTFIAMSKLIKEGKIGLLLDDIAMIRNIGKDINATDVKTLREDFQYGTQVKAEEKLVKNVCVFSESFVGKVKGLLHALWGEV